MEKIAFVGGGQMAGSLVGGLLAAGHATGSLRIAEPDAARAQVLRREFAVEVRPQASEVVDGAAAIVLAVKPQVLRAAVQNLKVPAGCVVISIAAGIRTETLAGWLGNDATLVRCMPNTPALLRQGVTALYAPPATPASARSLAERVLGSVGATCWVAQENLLDAVTALSGSGPAYYFLLTEALREAGRSLGLDAATANLLAEKTFIGAGRMAETGRDVADLRAQVTSKGGTTEAALANLESNEFRKRILDAVSAATRRSRELGTELDKN